MKRQFHIAIGNQAASANPRTLDGGSPNTLFARFKNILSGLAVSALAIAILIATVAVGSIIAGIVIAMVLLIIAWFLVKASFTPGRD
jgi:ABC-type multidrug transport system permease subunit